jgi:hypothetical protein
MGGLAFISMKRDSKEKKNQPGESTLSAREIAAQQLKKSEQAAKEVADLCAQASDTARLRKVPHAGVGGTNTEK